MNSRIKNVLLAFLFTTLFSITWIIGYQANPTLAAERIFTLLGGNFLGGGYIQFTSYFAFWLAVLELMTSFQNIKYQEQGFTMNLLPEGKIYVLSPEEVNALKLDMDSQEKEISLQKKSRFLITDLIKKACVKFDNNKVISEVMDIVVNQVRINRQQAESAHEIIRYLAWVIPSIGFIGTVIGISNALGIAATAETEEITRALGVAFDTTLVSLVLSVILMFLYHRLQEKEEAFHSNLEEYLIENLVNRIVLQ